jgi:hypothetical protein
MLQRSRALGEPPTIFDWSTLDVLPAPLRVALVVPQPRVCLACLASGYPSALFSVALLDACPIHDTPLVDHGAHAYLRCGIAPLGGRAYEKRRLSRDYKDNVHLSAQ